jgi:hypothetical protein
MARRRLGKLATMARNPARDTLRRFLPLVLAVLLAVLSHPRAPLAPGEHPIADEPATVTASGPERILTDQVTGSADASRAPPASFA